MDDSSVGLRFRRCAPRRRRTGCPSYELAGALGGEALGGGGIRGGGEDAVGEVAGGVQAVAGADGVRGALAGVSLASLITPAARPALAEEVLA